MDRPFRVTAPSVLVTVALSIALLHLAKPVLAPLALAALLSVVFASASARLERIGIGRVRLGRASAALVLALAISALFAGLGWIVASQGRELVEHLPEYSRSLVARIRAPIASLEWTVRKISQTGAPPSPAEVRVAESESQLMLLVRDWAGSAVSLLATAGVVVVLLVFLLIERDELRDRLLRIAGRGHLRITGSTMRDAADRVARYLRTLILLNCGHGLIVGLGLALIGVPLALLFGVLSATLRFVPYVGPWIAASAPIALSLASSDPLTTTVWVAVFLIGVELLSNNIVEPWLFGATVGLSPSAVVFSALFWAWLWGPIGLVLATPLTVSLVAIGRHVPKLEALSILLGDRKALLPHERIYERLLARESRGPDDLVAEQSRDQSPVEMWDRILIPALLLLERDRQELALSDEDVSFARAAFDAWIDELGEPSGEPSGELGAAAAREIVCIPAGEFGDEIVCAALARLLCVRGHRATAVARLLTSELVETVVAAKGSALVCVSALALRGGTVRYLVRRLEERSPGINVVVGFWGEDAAATPALRAGLPARANAVIATSLAEAADLLAARTTIERAPAEPERDVAVAGR